jgi:hypothetical protein
MELTRRDALAALASAGVVVGGGVAALAREPVELDGDGPDGETVQSVLVAVAEIVYPSAVSNVPAFVESYSPTRLRERPDYRDGVVEAVAELEANAAVWLDADSFLALDTESQERLLVQLGVRSAEPDPDGTTAERLRYYLVNELLFALYASPTGGELVGIENPQGHPGGTTSYQRRPGTTATDGSLAEER